MDSTANYWKTRNTTIDRFGSDDPLSPSLPLFFVTLSVELAAAALPFQRIVFFGGFCFNVVTDYVSDCWWIRFLIIDMFGFPIIDGFGLRLDENSVFDFIRMEFPIILTDSVPNAPDHPPSFTSSQSALVQLANMKVMMAKTMEDGDVAMKLLERAVTLSVMKEELVETLSVLVATEGRIQAAVLLGRTSLQ